MSGNNRTNKMTGCDAFSDSSEEAYKPSTTTKATIKNSIKTRSANVNKVDSLNSESVSISENNNSDKKPLVSAVATIYDNNLTESVTYNAIYEQQCKNTIANEVKNAPGLNKKYNVTKKHAAYKVAKPVFLRKPSTNKQTLIFGVSEECKIGQRTEKDDDTDNNASRVKRLQMKYAHDPNHRVNISGKYNPVKVEECEINTFSRMKKSVVKQVLTSQEVATKVITSPECDTLHAGEHLRISTSKKEYPFGSIVEICGSSLLPELFENEFDPPLFLGCVINPQDNDDTQYLNVKENQSYVEFVIAGECQWKNKRTQNTIKKVTSNNDLVLKCLPISIRNSMPNDLYDTVSKYFKNTTQGWKVGLFRSPCETCGSEFCLYNKNKIEFTSMFLKIQKQKDKKNNEKRFIAYSFGQKFAKGWNEGERRIRLGYCFVETVRGLFPSEHYTGFRS